MSRRAVLAFAALGRKKDNSCIDKLGYQVYQEGLTEYATNTTWQYIVMSYATIGVFDSTKKDKAPKCARRPSILAVRFHVVRNCVKQYE